MQYIDEHKLRSALLNVVDPDLKLNFSELNAIESITIDHSTILIKLFLIQPVQWIESKVKALCLEAVNGLTGDYDVVIEIEGASYDVSTRNVLPDVKNIIAVASGKGGVGKSAVAANIAASLALKGAKVGILDGDVYGPSQPTMFGLTDEPFQVYQDDKGKTIAFPIEKYGIKVASMGFLLNRNDAAILRGPMLAGYFSMLFEQLEWGELDFLVFDLPPGTGDIQLTMTQKIPLTGAVVVTTPQEISVADVRRSIAMFRKVNVDVLGIIENMSYFVPPDMPDKKYYIFGKGGGRTVAEEYNTKFFGEIPLNINMRETNDSGKPLVLHDNAGEQGAIIRDITASITTEIRKKNYEIINNPMPAISI